LTITETVLTFMGIPAAVTAIVFGLVYSGGAASSKRYRPGRKFASQPVWFLAAPRPGQPVSPDAHPAAATGTALAGRTNAGELTASADLELVHYGETGGASDSW
jgi:hypothetical protein